MKKAVKDFFEIVKETIVGENGESIPNDYTEGEMHAYRCYENSMTNGFTVNGHDVIACETLPKHGHITEFFNMLHEAEADEIAVTTENGLLDFIKGADAANWKVIGGCFVESHQDRTPTSTIVSGILLQAAAADRQE